MKPKYVKRNYLQNLKQPEVIKMARQFDLEYSTSNFLLLANNIDQGFHLGGKGHFRYTKSVQYVNEPDRCLKPVLNYKYYNNHTKQKMLLYKSNPDVLEAEKEKAEKEYLAQTKADEEAAETERRREEERKNKAKMEKKRMLARIGGSLANKVLELKTNKIRME